MGEQGDIFAPLNNDPVDGRGAPMVPPRPPAARASDHRRHVDHAAADRKRDIERLAPLAELLAFEAKERGITVDAIRRRAVERGYLTGREGQLNKRALSWLAAVPKAAKLVPAYNSDGSRTMRESELQRAHGNLQRVWLHPRWSGPG